MDSDKQSTGIDELSLRMVYVVGKLAFIDEWRERRWEQLELELRYKSESEQIIDFFLLGAEP